MKEVTYEEWQKNPTPRMMWVWDYDIELKVKRRVVYVSLREHFPVITVDLIGNVYTFCHCAEIEEPETRLMTNQEPETRLMTNQELAWWLSDGKHREWKYTSSNNVYSTLQYVEDCSNSFVTDDILIREDGGEWHKPLVGE